MAVLLHWPVFVPGVWIPEGGGDAAGFLLPLLDYASRSLRSGVLPLWNPYLYAGSPLAGDVQVGLFYPPNLGLMLALPRLTYGWLAAHTVLHTWWAGLGLYACARLLPTDGPPIRRSAAFVGGSAFLFSDLFVTHFGNPNLIAAAAWLPWAFGPFLRAVCAPDWRRARRWVALTVCAVGLGGLAGHPQPFVMMLLVLGFTALAVAVGRDATTVVPRWRGRARVLAVAIVTLALGVALAAIALVPAWELAGLSRRAALDDAAAAAYAIAPQQLAGILVPALFGRGMQRYWGPWPRVEVGYLGVVALGLALAAVGMRLRSSGRLRSTPVLPLAVLAVVAFVVALGDVTPLYGWLRALVPGLAGMRAPARFVLVADFALALLAAVGLDALLRTPRALLRRTLAPTALASLAVAVLVATPGLAAAARMIGDSGADRAARAWQAAGGVALAAAAIGALGCAAVLRARGRLGDRAFASAIAAALLVELAWAGSGMDRADWDPTTNHRPPAMSFLESDPGLYRIEVRPEAWGWWSPSAALLYDEFDVGGVYNPLLVADYQLFWESLTDRATPLYHFLNAKYVVAPKDFALPWDTFVPVYDDDPHLAIFLNTAAMPRAVLVQDWRGVDTHEAAWRAVHADGFDPAAEAVIETAPVAGLPDGLARVLGRSAASGPIAPPPDTLRALRTPVAEVTGYRRHEIDVVTESSAPTMLVLSEVWFPGWRASVDGRPAPIHRANYAFRAVPVPAGRHTVRLAYEPASVALGGLVTLLAAAAAMALGARRAA